MDLFISLIVLLSMAGFIGWVSYDPKNPWLRKKEVLSTVDFLLAMPDSSKNSSTSMDYDIGYAEGVKAAKAGLRPEMVTDHQIGNMLAQGVYTEIQERIENEMFPNVFTNADWRYRQMPTVDAGLNPFYFADFDEPV